eukprot:CAMPEP_0170592452 /NCGR_PEP_ID=MMETSP0224-20130122/12931_1 /TAXON_ID=285029 /ORGANISM="Togula jolla, Strain CCCM 725" /LENGTH=259 /DNA_ID=CAMNT_0010916357 /DNA_START=46 /DNA_END=826 /DNA_ORIENTATION=+
MAMKQILLACLVLSAAAAKYPVYSPGAGEAVETCAGVTCKDLHCKPPFVYKSPKEMGTCCPICWAESIKVPEDRSWAGKLSGGVAMDNNADPILCRDVVCQPLHCPEFEQMFDGRCCTKCKSSAAVTGADLAKGFKDMAKEAPVEEAAEEAPATEAPLTEEPQTEAPATTMPVTEATLTEEPLTETPMTAQPEPAAAEMPTPIQPMSEEPLTEEPLTEEPLTEAQDRAARTGGDTEETTQLKLSKASLKGPRKEPETSS